MPQVEAAVQSRTTRMKFGPKVPDGVNHQFIDLLKQQRADEINRRVDQIVLKASQKFNPELSNITGQEHRDQLVEAIIQEDLMRARTGEDEYRPVEITPIEDLTPEVTAPQITRPDGLPVRVLRALKPRGFSLAMGALTLLSACGPSHDQNPSQDISKYLSPTPIVDSFNRGDESDLAVANHDLPEQVDSSHLKKLRLGDQDIKNAKDINNGYAANIKGQFLVFYAVDKGIVDRIEAYEPGIHGPLVMEMFDSDPARVQLLEGGIETLMQRNPHLEVKHDSNNDAWFKTRTEGGESQGVDLFVPFDDEWRELLADISARVVQGAPVNIREGGVTRPYYINQGQEAYTPDEMLALIKQNPLLVQYYRERNLDVSNLVIPGKYKWNQLIDEAVSQGVPRAEAEKIFSKYQETAYRKSNNTLGGTAVRVVKGQAGYNEYSEDEDFWLVLYQEPGTGKLSKLLPAKLVGAIRDKCKNPTKGGEKPAPTAIPTEVLPTNTPTETATEVELPVLPVATGTPTPISIPYGLPGYEVPPTYVAPAQPRQPERPPFIPRPEVVAICVGLLPNGQPNFQPINIDQLRGMFPGANPNDIDGMLRAVFERNCRQLPPPPPELRYPVCISIGNFQPRNEFEIRNMAATLGINPNLSIPELLRLIEEKNCTVTPVIPVATTAITTSTATVIPIITPTPSETPAVFPTPTSGPAQPTRVVSTATQAVTTSTALPFPTPTSGPAQPTRAVSTATISAETATSVPTTAPSRTPAFPSPSAGPAQSASTPIRVATATAAQAIATATRSGFPFPSPTP